MKVEGIYIGDILISTKYTMKMTHMTDMLGIMAGVGHIEEESKLYKKDALLIKVHQFGYIDYDELKLFADIRIKNALEKNGGFKLGSIIMPEMSFGTILYVNSKNLKEVTKDYDLETDMSARQLRKAIGKRKTR